MNTEETKTKKVYNAENNETETFVNNSESENAEATADAGKKKAGFAAGVAVGAAAGAVGGAAAAMGIGTIKANAATTDTDEPTAETQPAEEPKHEEPKHEEPKEETPKEEAPKPAEPKEEIPEFFKEHEVVITNVTTEISDDGQMYHQATGYVDGHAAVFIDNGDGNISVSAVDLNDDNQLQEGEVINMSGTNVTLENLSDHIAMANPTPHTDDVTTNTTETNETTDTTDTTNNVHNASNQAPDVEVVAVEQNVEVDGGTIDVAVVTVNDNPMLWADTDHDGEVNAWAADVNGDGQLSANEIEDVSEAHIPMPTPADVTPQAMTADADIPNSVAPDGLPDYSNDADIAMYDV